MNPFRSTASKISYTVLFATCLTACSGDLGMAGRTDGGVSIDLGVASDAGGGADGGGADGGGADGGGPTTDSGVVGVPGVAPPTPLCSTASCTNYYVSSSTGNDANSGTSPESAWQTLQHVRDERSSINAGDTILFKRGDQFWGTFEWTKSGAEGRPITFGNYGEGHLPIFQLAPGNTMDLESRNVLLFGNTSYIVVDGFNVTDLEIAADPVRLADHDMFAYAGTAIRFDAYDFDAPLTGNVVKNCDISLTGLGIVFLGVTNNTMENNRITNLKNLVNTCGEPGTRESYEDYAANGLTLAGNDNFIIGNYFEGNWATSCDFEFNGGAIELYGAVNRNQFLYNTFIDNGGVAEFGSGDGATMADNVFAYNLMIANGAVSWANIDGPFASSVSNVQFYNNTVIDIGNRYTDSFLFGFNGSPTSQTIFNFKNNIFYIDANIDIVRGGADLSKYLHEDNVYVLSGGSETNFTLHSSEMNATGTIFTSMGGSDATTWNYALPPGSVAIGAGQPLGFTRDILGIAVPNPPDIGAYQHH